MIKLLRHLFELFSVLIVVYSGIRILGWIYGAMTPEPLPYSESQRHAAQETGQQVQAWLSTLPLERQSVVFGNLAHDPFGFVGNPVRNAIWRSGRFDLAPRTFWERLRLRMGWTLPCWPAGESLIAYGRSRGTELAIGGSVLGFADEPKPELEVGVEIVEIATGHTVASKNFVLRSSAIGRLLDPPVSSSSPAPGAVLLWLAAILFLPLGIMPFARPLLIEGSNFAILLTLFGLVAFDVGSAYVLYAGRCAGWPGAALILLLFGLSLALNFKYLTFMKELTL